jgi:Holliday junction resolvasome RuvABC ATP-dependent DNA helicase subunit
MAEKDNKILIRNKTVFQSEQFLPRTNYFNRFIGRVPELRLITAAWIAGDFSLPMSPLLIGEPGVGKNRLIYELAQKTGSQLYIFQGHEDVTSEDLACSVRFSDQSGTVMDYMLSPLVTAMIRGGICFIDEIGKIRPRALALLVSVLDERRYIDSTLLGERIHAHPGFRFVAATNTSDLNLLPEFIISRMRPQINIGYPPKEEIDNIIREQCKGIKKEVDKLIDLFWILWIDNGGKIGGIAPRDAIYLFGWASKLSAFEKIGGTKALMESRQEQPYQLKEKNSYTGIKPDHLKQAFQKLFKEQPISKD